LLIRAARRGDSEAAWPLARAFATSFRPERAAFDVTWERLLDASQTLLLVAETAERGIVGYLLGNSHLTFHANGPIAWIEELMVDANHRRSGVGRRLMDHAEEWARSGGAAYLALASRRAGPFYLALGYQESAAYFKKALNQPDIQGSIVTALASFELIPVGSPLATTSRGAGDGIRDLQHE
jgi:GNAT superfamily N-acetyltransferase